MSKVKILVKRDGSTINPANPIVEPILTMIEPAMLRGRYEIDRSSLYPVAVDSILRTDLTPGDIVTIEENLFGQSLYGVLSSIELRYSFGRPSMKVEVLRRV